MLAHFIFGHRGDISRSPTIVVKVVSLIMISDTTFTKIDPVPLQTEQEHNMVKQKEYSPADVTCSSVLAPLVLSQPSF